jgi:hypothetical protein
MMTVEPRPGVTSYQPREGAPVFLSDMIMELGLAEKTHVEAAVETARSSGETVGRVLIREGRLTEDDLARALAARYGLSHIDLEQFEVDSAAANLLPPAAARRYRAVPVDFDPGGSLLVAMADPSDSLALNDIAFMTKLEVHAAVAAENLIAALVERLPLPPSEKGSSGFPTPSAPAMRIPDAPPMPEEAVAAPPAPAAPPLDIERDVALRAELESTTAALDEERSKHESPAPEPFSAELDETRAELARAQAELQRMADELFQKGNELEHSRSELSQKSSELERAHSELAQKGSELDYSRAELGHKSSELEHARSELAQKGGELERSRTELAEKGGELDQARSELELSRAELEGNRSELERARAELSAARSELDRNRADLEKAHADVARASEALSRLDELDEAEARVHEAHATVERMRNEFEIEREQYATMERDLRARLASESEQHEALRQAQGALQKRVDALRAQNAALLDAYATAKRWSAEFARGARELANTLEQPVLDDAVRAQQPPAGPPGGGATSPPDRMK